MRKILFAVVGFFGTYVAAQTYCTPEFALGCSGGDVIENFAIPSVGFADIATGCSSNSYDDRTNLIIPLSPGGSFAYTVTHGYSSQQVRIWIDFNNDGTFDDAAPELVSMAESQDVNGVSTTDGTIIIPQSVPFGTYRMRIGDRYSSQPIPCNVSGYGEAHDYTVSIGAPSTCLVPTNVTVTGVTTDTAVFNWVAPSSTVSVGYEYYYSTSNVSPTSTTAASGNAGPNVTSATITPLVPATTYYGWIRTVCTSVDKSVWYPTGSFTTECVATNIPYNQDFESVTAPEIPLCTEVTNDGSGNVWETEDFNGYGGFVGNALVYFSSWSDAADTWYFTQGLNLTAGTSYRLRFKHGVGSQYSPEDLKVAYGQSPNSTAMTNSIVDLPGMTNEAAMQSSSIFTPSTTGVYYIGFHAYSPSSTYMLAIDDIEVVVAPSCNEPSALTATAITTNSATIGWSASAPIPALGYEYYYTNTNTPPTATTTASGNTTSLSVGLNSLTPSTDYYVWVRSVCSTTDKSEWSPYLSFQTNCVSVTTLPWSENFDSMTTMGEQVLPNCWATSGSGANADTNYFGTFDAAEISYNDPNSGANYVAIYYPYGGPASLWTPAFELTAGVTYTFGFSWVGDGYSNWQGDAYVSTDGSLGTATSLGASFVDETVTTDQTYTTEAYTFTPTTTGTYHFGVSALATSTAPYYLGFDDFTVTNQNLSTSEVTIVKNTVKIYPNPFTDVVNISDVSKVKSISVMDASGKLVKTISKPNSQIHLGELSAGMYLLVLNNTDGTQQTIKVLKK